MEEKSSGKKKKTRTSNPPAEASMPAAAAVASHLTDDIIVEILSRLPAKSVHRFKCVSPSWRDLIADPAHRKKLPHTLLGFFYNTYGYSRVDPRSRRFHFANVSVGAAPSVDVDPSLPFLPQDKYLYVAQLDTCNGLLLCLGCIAPSSSVLAPEYVVESHYIVCNPATKRWVHLPPLPEVPPGAVFARLAFDPAVSSHFYVLQFDETEQEESTAGVTIYSSQTGAWKHRKSSFAACSGVTSVFFHGMLHLLAWLHPLKTALHVVLVAVDMEGRVRDTIPLPSGGMSFYTIGLSQGCLHFATTPLTCVERNKKGKKHDDTSLPCKTAQVWYMKDYNTREWVLKHSFSKDELRTETGVEYKVAAIHPHCDTIFLDSRDADTLASYDTRQRKLRHILYLEKNKLALFVPYVPLFSDSFAGTDG
ncbi:F-box protein At5g49610-like [Lolium perenne]|uniref:F-box protein At5g49610-like n=1 Tax=Lolium perenne TaxID=4522 RepID=UPI0021EAE5AC|nr:F-box only protein 8-like [Lolium perenne]